MTKHHTWGHPSCQREVVCHVQYARTRITIPGTPFALRHFQPRPREQWTLWTLDMSTAFSGFPLKATQRDSHMKIKTRKCQIPFTIENVPADCTFKGLKLFLSLGCSNTVTGGDGNFTKTRQSFHHLGFKESVMF